MFQIINGPFRGIGAFFVVTAFLLLLSNGLLNHNSAPSHNLRTSAPIVERGLDSRVKKVAVAFGLQAREAPHPLPRDPDNQKGVHFLIGGNHLSKHEVVKRALSWEKAVEDGKAALARCNLGTGSSAITLADLTGKNKGWSVPKGLPPRNPPDLGTALLDITGTADPAGTIQRKAVQDQPYNAGGQTGIAASFGFYDGQFNPDKGILIALNSWSPTEFLAQKGRPDDPKPDVQRWSDVIWQVWADTAGGEAGNLKYIFRHQIYTEDTKRIMERAMGVGLNAINKPWPGQDFFFDSDEGKALLGTAHGKGVSWILHDHRNSMTHRSLQKVTVFTTLKMAANGNENQYQLLFTLV